MITTDLIIIYNLVLFISALLLLILVRQLIYLYDQLLDFVISSLDFEECYSLKIKFNIMYFYQY